MSLVNRFYSLIENAVRNRGRSYYHQGAVRITAGDEQSVQARVRGTENYKVILTIDGDSFFVSCTCPYFETDICKHVWATMLAAEARGFLKGIGPLPSRLRMAGSDSDDEDYYDADDDDYEEDDDDDESMIIVAGRRQASPLPQQPSHAHWRQHIVAISQAMKKPLSQRADAWSSNRELFYVVNKEMTLAGSGLIVELAFRERKKNGEWSKIKTQGFPPLDIPRLPDPADSQIIALMVGAKNQYEGYYSGSDMAMTRYRLLHPLEQTLMPLMCRTGRCLLRLSQDEMTPLEWDEGGAWEFWLEVRRSKASNQYAITGSLRRDDERLELSEPALLTAGGLVFGQTKVARLNDFESFAWISLLRRHDVIYVPVGQESKLLEDMLGLPDLPRLELTEELRFEEVKLAPRPQLKISKPEQRYWGQSYLRGELSFDYGGEVVESDDQKRGVFQADARRLILRDREAELSAAERLKQLGFRRGYSYSSSKTALELNPDKLPRVVRELVRDGWHIEAEGKLYRQPGEFRIEVTSGIDWFDLHGTVEFGETTASLPDLLAALKRGEKTVSLGDGTFGLLPEEWLEKYGLLAGLGKAEGERLRFTRGQVGLLDALLASQSRASFDAAFARTRDELQSFKGIKPADPPSSFIGALRPYQREGLGWFYFLQRFGFGGCLADDMGLGKTIMALALLESRREQRAGDQAHRGRNASAKNTRKKKKASGNGVPDRIKPSLVVVPKSLVFNWKQEAARFTPDLRVLDHTGAGRLKTCDHFDDYDLVVTTYGTLRRDAIQFKDTEFDYVILDEAQAIKNASTESSKAARLLRGANRLALSGTPVENHLGELWSLFEFLNPGLLGAASVFRLSGTAARNPDEHTRALLASALRPFILRRTKQQVAKDLPAKLEQTIYCEMGPVQRKLYDELRDHYRRSLLGLIERKGIKQSKIQILEALLRLRQAACHPGLVDKSRAAEPAAKLDVLLPQLGEVIEEGHKALVFSQFTSLLAIVRKRLDDEGIVYEYLDGRTRDRAARVERFQTDPDCRLFLVSLKAGGLGLNLTAAEYVFLLDPWWNPAVEAQAIDRAHRIGQKNQVFAYRLIARDTVEEKVLELQGTKRALADAIINADNSLIRGLAREDLELLLS